MRKALRSVKNLRLGGILVGIAVDLIILIIVPGSSIIEGVLAFVAGLSAGIGYMHGQRHTA